MATAHSTDSDSVEPSGSVFLGDRVMFRLQMMFGSWQIVRSRQIRVRSSCNYVTNCTGLRKVSRLSLRPSCLPRLSHQFCYNINSLLMLFLSVKPGKCDPSKRSWSPRTSLKSLHRKRGMFRFVVDVLLLVAVVEASVQEYSARSVVGMGTLHNAATTGITVMSSHRWTLRWHIKEDRCLNTGPKVPWQTKPRACVFDVDSSQYDLS
ncbi:hypothetical protein J1N35_003897 [Gossypium stocksii]|uniref:Uncharacterized protein n=1 Tax=Gossypium stocksii TaxID=47602 RepID=A0A9D4AFJ4_9ROSI|nr:hypothetical protein J1N35_003897 [Gossypium stocksii]